MTYAEILKANKETIVSIINDEIIFTNSTLKGVMAYMLENEEKFNQHFLLAISDEWYSKEEKAFTSFIKEIVSNQMTFKHDVEFEANQNKHRNAQMRSSFN